MGEAAQSLHLAADEGGVAALPPVGQDHHHRAANELASEHGNPELLPVHLLAALIEDKVEGLLHPQRYGPEDSRWVTKIAEAMLERLAKGNHAFNPVPAEHEISDDARVVVVGDWGSGLKRAR